MLRPPKISIVGPKLTSFKIAPDTHIIIRGLKLTDDHRTRIECPGYDFEIVMTDLPYDGTQLHLLFGADGTHKSIVTQDPKYLFWGPENSFVSDGQTFNTGEQKFSISSNCGSEEMDCSVNFTLGLFPGASLLTIRYDVEK